MMGIKSAIGKEMRKENIIPDSRLAAFSLSIGPIDPASRPASGCGSNVNKVKKEIGQRKG
jgi:hypothetical protein